MGIHHKIKFLVFILTLAFSKIGAAQDSMHYNDYWQGVPHNVQPTNATENARASRFLVRSQNQIQEEHHDLTLNQAIRPQNKNRTYSQAQRLDLLHPKLDTKTKPSALEAMYSRRIVDELPQFGYDMFGVPSEATQNALDTVSNATPPMGAVQDDFILNVGDELDIAFTGQRTDRGLYKVSSQGTILIKDFPPIPAAGRTIGQVTLSVQNAANNLYNTQAYISLSSVRQIGVLVVGHVKKPGRHNLTVFHTVIDALMQSGGIQKTGSLRQIKLVRNGRSTFVDLYALLLGGSASMDLRLKDGDRIIIPAIGPTVAVAGEVKNPGIFEMKQVIAGMMHKPEEKGQKLSLNEMLELSGGVLSPGKNRFLHLGVSKAGTEKVDEIEKPFERVFGDGSILLVSKGDEKREGTVELEGHTRRPGLHALGENKTLSKLLNSDQLLGPDIYPLIGVIKRWDKDQLSYELLDFPLKLVLSGEYDRQLNEGDTILLFSNKQIKNLTQNTQIQNVSYGSYDPENSNDSINDPTLHSFLTERAVFVRGAVRSEGSYPVSQGISLDNVMAVTGGMALEADTANIEITSKLQGKGLQSDGRSGTRRIKINLHETSSVNVPIGRGDSIRINQKFKKIEDKSVRIMGEVVNPGQYDLIPGDKLSDLLSRAGGLTNQAYPDGAIFSRESERKAEEARFKSQARMMKQAVAAALEKDDDKIGAGQIAEARSLAKELEDAEGVGRITVSASPEILALNPELDLLLETGDRLYIPKRTLTVRVRGEVLSPASLQFREKKDPLDYINEAGGFTFHADKDRTFVLLPDGSAKPLRVSSWNHTADFIPPGSTIIIPRDPKPFDFIESAKDVSQILSNLAITAIFIDDVRDD